MCALLCKSYYTYSWLFVCLRCADDGDCVHKCVDVVVFKVISTKHTTQQCLLYVAYVFVSVYIYVSMCVCAFFRESNEDTPDMNAKHRRAVSTSNLLTYLLLYLPIYHLPTNTPRSLSVSLSLYLHNNTYRYYTIHIVYTV